MFKGPKSKGRIDTFSKQYTAANGENSKLETKIIFFLPIKCELQDAKAKEEEASQHAHKPHFPQDDYPLDCQCYLKSQHRNYCYLFLGFFIFIGYFLLGNLSQHQGFVATTFVDNV